MCLLLEYIAQEPFGMTQQPSPFYKKTRFLRRVFYHYA
ncbi:hypothetical protein B4094_3318 [Bacillus licheniformis]|nr:hypothetical protein B4094_3318 [Bacillus licheniformis]TWM41112.1 hypothetical protein CHCC14818_0953 [Bacillus licheniformis]TWN03305.1 hypothetical protein CHCC14566_1146 [Bacillus licheniformis]